MSQLSKKILHLSDLHFGTSEQAKLWSGQLVEDLQQNLDISKLDALILSGDIANFSTPEEYKAATEFLDEFFKDFPLKSEQIIIVPGNHDLNWDLSEEAYSVKYKDKCKPNELKDGRYIDVNDKVVEVINSEKYPQRFTNFKEFYDHYKGNIKAYPLETEQQYSLDIIGENILILGLNSAWELDHHYKSRATINNTALTNALNEIRRNDKYKNCPLKIAVWHHPINSPDEDRIKDSDFLQRLAVNDFNLFLHGHIHKAENDEFRYDMSIDGRKLHRICAGTFGAPTKELNTGIPWQYNLLKIEADKITVSTRKRESENGAWEGDFRWRYGRDESKSYYEIELKSINNNVAPAKK
jgi:3',5'-cyclic AMP phosphodiesterase CpdA